MSMERFEACLAVTLGFEGGFTDDENDHGGATNLGIEYREWNAWKDSQGLPESSLHDFANDLTAADVEPIYLKNYWMPVNDGTLPGPVDMVAFDAAVLEGVPKALEYLNDTAGAPDAPTRAAQMQALRTAHFRAIVADDPTQNVFLVGWLNRVNELSAMIRAGQI